MVIWPLQSYYCEHIDLRTRPPRHPLAQLDGLVMLPRTIDKARALLAGTIGDYDLQGHHEHARARWRRPEPATNWRDGAPKARRGRRCSHPAGGGRLGLPGYSLSHDGTGSSYNSIIADDTRDPISGSIPLRSFAAA